MSRYAEVIVDVPAMQTNHPFTYQIPAKFQDFLQIGMRVVVEFGNGNRKIQGFVTGLTDEYSGEHQLKSVIDVLDLNPVLSDEAMAMADWLTQRTFAFKIRCLQVMLPNAMRASYRKTLKLTGKNITPDLATLFDHQNEVEFNPQKLTSSQLNQIEKLRKANQVEIVYHVDDRAKSKLVWAFKAQMTVEELQTAKKTLRKNAAKQKRLLDFLITNHEQEFVQSDVTRKNNFTANDLKVAAEKGWITRYQVEKYRNPYQIGQVQPSTPKKLTAEQAQATNAVDQAIDEKQAATFLLEGVTGSGKTEVYLQIIQHALAQGKSALMLVPEISLTPQIVRQFKARFGDQVALLHSALSDGERYDEWRRIEKGDAQVVVGARSAIFAPIKNLGVIIMDEEHETSYKQEDMPRYHARDVAQWRGQYHHCPVVLGSATPSLESRARAQKGVYQWLRLTKRINGKDLPQVQLVDMRQAGRYAPTTDISQELATEIQKKLALNEQVVLMLNRRGYSSFLMCRECGEVIKCPNCDISLTYHKDTNSLKCHYCGHEEPVPQVCPNCHSKAVRYFGTGTQRVEKELTELFPTARILRMDVDTTRRKGAHERILDEFGKHHADILLGTQMIAKGLDFPNVTLVGVLNADTSLGLPDFRASERTFQLLTQVSGRAGRAEKEGNVLIQTYNPDHYAIQYAQRQDYEHFFGKEMQVRHQGGYPPYYYTIQITASARTEADAAQKMFQICGEIVNYLSQNAVILGPTPQSIMRINNRYYYQLVIKYKNEPQLENYLQNLLLTSQKEERNGLQIVIDRDPMNFI
ncbi:primosomal protein N' [Ligilactobacillus aviarius]|uniref:Replication restart protein PriA n=1 Tax=Ligilactobacillus aviarius TaxID=1606 RepID=A0A179CUV3_9LACO|nr:primosomal protein N' [Ligilactobacillus aviarius]OAP97465.1 primosomal protein N' [Ligilactobacillus aviarius]OAQ00864.1 primosomal protein N' [Ligilactobacillus aviarius]OAQ01129.1 primosomal protein N' [Ligilactobacillus aviarius]OAQ06117.1 primosomal protein N' [Ligilactobacillus aviarius]OAQ08664.1 primosomal protein N' [Ligilactobacillus aviarius]